MKTSCRKFPISESDADNFEPDVVEEEDDYDESGNFDEKDLGRSDDPVRMYLKEMGTVELLSREGEIAIAKRIEAGKTVMIWSKSKCSCATSSIWK